ncbi:unnamed protein product [Pieris macdunnoughi]|uniref:Uncharacterized protein n=1 Tax=Pieris macdunnoughi TaxID=345717 RepID=A0A821WTB5_9NEOP|nr:unnamed protein product [Pieris macdunnoughi]
MILVVIIVFSPCRVFLAVRLYDSIVMMTVMVFHPVFFVTTAMLMMMPSVVVFSVITMFSFMVVMVSFVALVSLFSVFMMVRECALAPPSSSWIFHWRLLPSLFWYH